MGKKPKNGEKRESKGKGLKAMMDKVRKTWGVRGPLLFLRPSRLRTFGLRFCRFALFALFAHFTFDR
ncbi:hypothetical protein LuPra_00417 [Luteitalea pratensis]|uniref:Uncharacterized protein n=1 Tax=Luteitalea pratensis TaxID=1855912 RepID=A0A143PG59_LUTPR|nr:hypothetical protein LuPra_00417 [Luteitalea pratensis]